MEKTLARYRWGNVFIHQNYNTVKMVNGMELRIQTKTSTIDFWQVSQDISLGDSLKNGEGKIFPHLHIAKMILDPCFILHKKLTSMDERPACKS